LDGLEKGYVLLGRLEAAEKVVSSLFQLHREAGDPLEQGRCLVRLAALYSGTGRYSEAIVASRTSVGFFFKAHDYESASLALTQLGLDYAFAGHLDKAEDSLQDAASTAREINEGPVTARLWAAFGFLYQWTSQFSEARSYLVQAVELLLRLGQEAQARACLAVLAAVCQRSGELDEAESIYADLVDEAQSVEDLESLGCSLRGLIQIGAAKSEMAESKSWLHHPTMDRIAATDPALYAEIHLDYAKEVLTCSRIPGLVSEEDIQDAARGALSGLVYLDSTGLVFRSRDTRAALASRISSYRNLVSEILDRVGDPRLMAEWIELSFSLIKPGHMPQEPRVGAGPEAWMLNRLDPAGSAAGPTIGAVLQHVARAGSHRLLTGTGLPAGPGPLLLSPGVHNGPHCHFALGRHIDAVPYPAMARPVPILAW
jgi:tetratricopeptide (TPR) repeat protein